MRQKPIEIHAFRFGKWTKIMSDELYPGDVILMKKNKDDKKSLVPCDLLILSG